MGPLFKNCLKFSNFLNVFLHFCRFFLILLFFDFMLPPFMKIAPLLSRSGIGTGGALKNMFYIKKVFREVVLAKLYFSKITGLQKGHCCRCFLVKFVEFNITIYDEHLWPALMTSTYDQLLWRALMTSSFYSSNRNELNHFNSFAWALQNFLCSNMPHFLI